MPALSTVYCILILFGFTLSQSSIKTINTKLGAIQGNTYGVFSTFMGIPYTEDPPIGDNRFRPSVLKTSSYLTTFNATSAGPQCLQPDDATSSEDCLTLNVYTPDPTGSYPVMVWIHGGGFQSGSGFGHGTFSGTNFVTKGIVFVSINYRLGLLGFLPLAQIAQETGNTNGGMNGIYDQIIALRWIKHYISDYGGNANDVTIFGESAGGLSVCTLLFSPVATSLFHKAIIQSGACNGGWGAQPKAFATTVVPLQLWSYGMANDNLTMLRLRPSSDFQKLGGLPTVDGYIAPNDHVLNLTGSIATLNARKIMIGSNSMDTLSAWPWYSPMDPFGHKTPIAEAPKTAAEMTQYLTAYFGQTNDTLASDILSSYYQVQRYEALDVFSEYQIMWLSMNSEACLVCPSFDLLNWIIANDGYFSGDIAQDLYLYHFVGPTAPYYAQHFSEVPFVFGLNYVNSKMHMNWDQTLSDAMNTAWINFVKDEADDNLVPFNNGNAVIFGGENGIQHVSNYDNDYKYGWCPFLATEALVQTAMCAMNVAVEVTNVTSVPTNTLSPSQTKEEDANVAENKSGDATVITVLIVVVVLMALVIIGGGIYWMKRERDHGEKNDTDEAYRQL